jgi:Flp pilus assembly protein TadD
MPISWTTPTLLPGPAREHTLRAFSDEAAAVAETERPWIWFVGKDRSEARSAAEQWIHDLRPSVIVAPPSAKALPVLLEDLETASAGELVVFAPDLELSFHDTMRSGSFCLSSSLYVIPRLLSKVAPGTPVTFIASSSEDSLRARGQEVLAQRGLASRFAFRRRPGNGPTEDGGAEPEGDEDEGLDEVQSILQKGLATRDPEARAAAYARAESLAPERALVQLFLASSLAERGQGKEAFEKLRRALELDPDLAPAHYELGKLTLRLDDMESALAAFRRTAELVPEFSSAWGNLGAALGEIRDLDGALVALRTAVELDPMSHALRSNLGVTYRDRGELDRAEKECSRAVEMAPDFVFGHYNLAHVYFLQGRYAEAIGAFERARSMDKNRSPRQGLLLAATRLAGGDVEGALRDYRSVFDAVNAQMRRDMRTVAEWDLKQLATRTGVSPSLKQAVSLIRSFS